MFCISVLVCNISVLKKNLCYVSRVCNSFLKCEVFLKSYRIVLFLWTYLFFIDLEMFRIPTFELICARVKTRGWILGVNQEMLGRLTARIVYCFELQTCRLVTFILFPWKFKMWKFSAMNHTVSELNFVTRIINKSNHRLDWRRG